MLCVNLECSKCYLGRAKVSFSHVFYETVEFLLKSRNFLKKNNISFIQLTHLFPPNKQTWLKNQLTFYDPFCGQDAIEHNLTFMNISKTATIL